MNTSLSPIQQKLLEAFHFFSDFCTKHKLSYYAASGTCLGAIRHHGFIPWDDDIDLFMLRTDYDRLLDLKNDLANESRGVYTISDILDGCHPYPFAKFYSTSCTIWELKQFPFLMGPWIDIFPVDEWNESKEANDLYDDFNLALWNYRKSLSYQTWKEIISDTFRLNGLEGPIKFVKHCFYKPFKRVFYKRCKKCIDKIRRFRGNQYKSWSLVKNEVYKKDWFSSGISVPFEDTTIIVPIGYSEYLSHLFGDYMTPPPESDRNSTHHFYFIDLDKKWTVEEILKNPRSKSSGENKLPLRVVIDEIKHRKGFTR